MLGSMLLCFLCMDDIISFQPSLVIYGMINDISFALFIHETLYQIMILLRFYAEMSVYPFSLCYFMSGIRKVF